MHFHTTIFKQIHFMDWSLKYRSEFCSSQRQTGIYKQSSRKIFQKLNVGTLDFISKWLIDCVIEKC